MKSPAPVADVIGMVEVCDAQPQVPGRSPALVATTLALATGLMTALSIWTPMTYTFGMLGVAFAVLLFWHFERHFARPTRALRRLLQHIRDGNAAVCELDDYAGAFGLAVLIPEIQHVLRERKEILVRHDQEVRQRVAGKTHALERQLGALRISADRDGLTGLKNRSAFDRTFAPLIETCAHAGRGVSVIMGDLDHFKRLNDTLGHLAGDDLLTQVGHLIASHVREGEFAFRYGGDEFVLLLPDLPIAKAHKLAGRLTSLIAALSKSMRVDHKPTFTYGVAELTVDQPDTPQALLQLADERLYRSKQERGALRAA